MFILYIGGIFMEYYIELIRKKIGLNIKRLRSSNGYSRQEFAKKDQNM